MSNAQSERDLTVHRTDPFSIMYAQKRTSTNALRVSPKRHQGNYCSFQKVLFIIPKLLILTTHKEHRNGLFHPYSRTQTTNIIHSVPGLGKNDPISK